MRLPDVTNTRYHWQTKSISLTYDRTPMLVQQLVGLVMQRGYPAPSSAYKPTFVQDVRELVKKLAYIGELDVHGRDDYPLDRVYIAIDHGHLGRYFIEEEHQQEFLDRKIMGGLTRAVSGHSMAGYSYKPFGTEQLITVMEISWAGEEGYHTNQEWFEMMGHSAQIVINHVAMAYTRLEKRVAVPVHLHDQLINVVNNLVDYHNTDVYEMMDGKKVSITHEPFPLSCPFSHVYYRIKGE